MFKSKASDEDQIAAINVAEVMQRTVQPQEFVGQPPPRREPTADAVTRSCIGSGMLIVGNIERNGPAQVLAKSKAS
jgi:hypothetical protein